MEFKLSSLIEAFEKNIEAQSLYPEAYIRSNFGNREDNYTIIVEGHDRNLHLELTFDGYDATKFSSLKCAKQFEHTSNECEGQFYHSFRIDFSDDVPKAAEVIFEILTNLCGKVEGANLNYSQIIGHYEIQYEYSSPDGHNVFKKGLLDKSKQLRNNPAFQLVIEALIDNIRLQSEKEDAYIRSEFKIENINVIVEGHEGYLYTDILFEPLDYALSKFSFTQSIKYFEHFSEQCEENYYHHLFRLELEKDNIELMAIALIELATFVFEDTICLQKTLIGHYETIYNNYSSESERIFRTDTVITNNEVSHTVKDTKKKQKRKETKIDLSTGSDDTKNILEKHLDNESGNEPGNAIESHISDEHPDETSHEILIEENNNGWKKSIIYGIITIIAILIIYNLLKPNTENLEETYTEVLQEESQNIEASKSSNYNQESPIVEIAENTAKTVEDEGDAVIQKTEEAVEEDVEEELAEDSRIYSSNDIDEQPVFGYGNGGKLAFVQHLESAIQQNATVMSYCRSKRKRRIDFECTIHKDRTISVNYINIDESETDVRKALSNIITSASVKSAATIKGVEVNSSAKLYVEVNIN